MKRIHMQKGLSLIEMMVVVAAMGIMLSATYKFIEGSRGPMIATEGRSTLLALDQRMKGNLKNLFQSSTLLLGNYRDLTLDPTSSDPDDQDTLNIYINAYLTKLDDSINNGSDITAPSVAEWSRYPYILTSPATTERSEAMWTNADAGHPNCRRNPKSSDWK